LLGQSIQVEVGVLAVRTLAYLQREIWLRHLLCRRVAIGKAIAERTICNCNARLVVSVADSSKEWGSRAFSSLEDHEVRRGSARSGTSFAIG
jgi:hypothetical protein